MTNRREASKTETRNLILKAARKLLREEGVDQWTMRAVAKEAGVSPATVILHFNSKTSLLEVAINEDIERTFGEVLSKMPEKADLIERLMHIPKAMYSFYGTDRALYRALVRNTVFEPEETNPHIKKQLDEYFTFLSHIIDCDKKEGNIRGDVDPHIAALCIGSLYMGVLILFFRNPEITPGDATALLRGMTAQYLSGILAGRQ